jgi:ABC-2 type transport system permease protein
MFTIVTGAGILTAQIKHGSVWGTNYTTDVKAVAKDLDMSKAEVADDLNLILSNEQELQIGADARNIEVDVYKAYLTLAMQDAEGTPSDQAMSDEQSKAMQDKMMAGLTAAATALNMEVSDLSTDMGIIKDNEAALTAACEASELPKEMFVNIINQQLAATELSNDEAVDFDLSNFIMLNVGVLLFLFAISGISFLASCSANLSKYSLTFGAGIPIAFFLFKTVAQTSDSLEVFKYFTLNTLYDASAIAVGTVDILPLVVLFVVGIVLYFLSVQVFKRKDLPL